jgi:hypothetical protein
VGNGGYKRPVGPLNRLQPQVVQKLPNDKQQQRITQKPLYTSRNGGPPVFYKINYVHDEGAKITAGRESTCPAA